MKSGDLTGFEREATQDVQSGHDVWIDTTAGDALAESGAIFSPHYGAVWELVNSRHRIRFALWRPLGVDSYHR